MYPIYPIHEISLYKPGSGAGALRKTAGTDGGTTPPLWVPKIRNEPPMSSFNKNIRP